MKDRICVYIKKGTKSNIVDIMDCANDYAVKLGMKAPEMLFKTYRGKPYFVDSNIHISISHSKDYVVYAFSESNIGIDLQYITDANRAGVSKRFFNKDECDYLESNGYNDFFKVWTAKESYVKFLGTGIAEHFKKTSVIQKGKYDNIFKFIDVLPDYVMCLCGIGIGSKEIKIISK